jgi:hypothetical protein
MYQRNQPNWGLYGDSLATQLALEQKADLQKMELLKQQKEREKKLKAKIAEREKDLQQFRIEANSAWKETDTALKVHMEFMNLMMGKLDDQMRELAGRVRDLEKPVRKTGDFLWDNTCPRAIPSPKYQTISELLQEDETEEPELIGLAELAEQVD